MEVLNVTWIMDGWLTNGPASLSTIEDCGWPAKVADIVLANKDRKVKSRSQLLSESPSPEEK